MKKQIWCILGLFFVFAFANAQEYISHQVQSGETVYSISKKYKVSEKEILKLNPDAKDSIYEGLVLILPNAQKAVDGGVERPKDELDFKTHKVKRKETLYSISRKYNVPEDIIKKHNTELYNKPLRKGAKLKIPANYQKVIAQIEKTEDPVSSDNTLKKYKVIAKETKYGIARSYGLTISDLEKLNPGLGEGLQIGQELFVPNKEPIVETTIDTSQFELYEVKQGDTMFSLLRKLNIKADELVSLNPSLDEGLKYGMILKIPRGFNLSLIHI